MTPVRDDGLDGFLEALKREDCYRVDRVLKQSGAETTERVYFKGANGSEMGPYVRKIIAGEETSAPGGASSGAPGVYERLREAHRKGRRFVHIPVVYECCSRGRDSVVIMECVPGETLQEAVRRRGPSLSLACEVFPQLCEAVSELHESFDPPIVHRDLKPSNIMVSEVGLSVIDFGIARTYRAEADDDTRHLGTREYAPPEQFGFGQTDVRSDVYALGLLLYYCLVGKTPSPRVRREGFADKEVPESVAAVIRKAAAFDPAARYQSARELRAAFEEALLRQEGAFEECVRNVEPPAGDDTKSRALRVALTGWNVLVVAALAVWALACIVLAVDPSQATAEKPPSRFPSLQYALFVFPVGVSAAWMLMWRKPFRRFAAVAPVLFAHPYVLGGAGLLVGLIAVGTIGVLFPA